MTKQEEIDRLHQITTDLPAGYLKEALAALGYHFESTVRSDFPGGLAACDLREECDNLREELIQLKADRREVYDQTASLKKQRDGVLLSLHDAKKQLQAIADRIEPFTRD